MNIKIKLLSIIVLIGYFASAQKELTKESWESILSVFSLKGDHKISSDAVVLFEGGDLSKWKRTNDSRKAKSKIDKKKSFFTVLHNGILIQNHIKLLGITEYIGWSRIKPHSNGSIGLQDYRSKVRYRNYLV